LKGDDNEKALFLSQSARFAAGHDGSDQPGAVGDGGLLAV